MGRGTRTRICTVLVGWPRRRCRSRSGMNGTRRVLLALGRYLPPTRQRNHRQRDAERRRRGAYELYASLVALARLAMRLAHPLLHTPCIGRMKRPDIGLPWREKVTIVWLIFILSAVVIFYIMEIGCLLCPNFDKPWTSNEVAEHSGTTVY